MKLTQREKDVIKAVEKYKYRKIAAEKLGLAIKTIDAHLHNAYSKYGVRSFYELLRKLEEV